MMVSGSSTGVIALAGWLACLVTAAPVPAAQSGLFTYEIVDDAIEITDYPTTEVGELTIPATIVGKPVTFIGHRAFNGCRRLTRIILPPSVTNIGSQAFAGCVTLTEMTIPPAVTHIGWQAFRACAFTTVTIPASVSDIGIDAFFGCRRLLEFVVDPSNQDFSSIDGVLLNGDQTLLIQFPAAKAGTYTFSLTVSNFTRNCFWQADQLTTFHVEPGHQVFSAHDGVLYDMDQTRVVKCPPGKVGTHDIPDGATSVGALAFYGCAELSGITLPNSMTDLGDSAFCLCSGLTAIDLPESITTMGPSVFSSSGLVSIVIPEGISVIGDDAFGSCDDLTSILLPSTLTSIGDGAFYSCDDLARVDLPEDLQFIGAAAFGGSGLTELILPPSVTQIGSSAFNSCTSLRKVVLPDGMTVIPTRTFESCHTLTSVSIPSSINVIEDLSFRWCFALPSIEIPEGVAIIGSNVFADCDSLERVTLPESLISVGQAAFYRCSALEQINLPAQLTRLAEGVFDGCSSLPRIVIPAGITEIETDAFDGCGMLAEIYFLGDAPDVAAGAFTFPSLNSSAVLFRLASQSGFPETDWFGYPVVAIDDTTYPATPWLLKYGLDYDADLTQDLNGDGVPLVMAYALNLDPRRHLQTTLPGPELGADELKLTFYGASAGVTYSAQTSDDLENWTDTGVSISELGPGNLRTATVDRGASRRFLRLLVSTVTPMN